MGSLDEKISVVKAKPWLVSLVCAVFIAYPNLAWIFCDMSYLAPNDHQGFLLFFGFRFLLKKLLVNCIYGKITFSL